MNKPFNKKAHEELSESLTKWLTRTRNDNAHGLMLKAYNPAFLMDRISWIASLLYIKWVEYQDCELEAIAEFNGESYEPLIPYAIRRRNDSNDDVSAYLFALHTHINSTNNPNALNLKRVFSLFDPNGEYSVRDANVADKIITGYDFSDPRQLEAASTMLESIIHSAAEQSKAADNYTPKSIVDLMVELVNPQVGEQIYDPCFGAGGLLVESAKRLHAASKTLAGGQWEKLRSSSIYGVEWNETAYVIALSRIVLAGIPEPGLELTNALMRPRGESSFDVVLACPPWGQIDNEIRESLRLSFNVPARDWSSLFIQHIMQVLRPGGRAVIAVPEGFLFGAGPDLQLRKWLLSDFRVDGIVSLPEGSFAPYTGIKSSLILIRREQPVESVYFYQVQKLAGTAAKVAAKEEKAQDIAKRFNDREIGSYSWTTPIVDLVKHNWELVAKKSGDEQLNKWLNKICTSETKVQKLSLQQVAVVATGIKYDRKMATEKQTADDDFRLIRIADIRDGILGRPSLFISKTASSQINTDLCIRSNDILLSKTGTIGKMAFVHSEGLLQKTTATQSLVIIRHNELILPEYLYALLTSVSYQQWMDGHARGAAIQHLPTDSLRHIPLPVPEIQIQDRVVKELKQRKEADPLALLAEIVIDKESKKTSEDADLIQLATIAANLPSAITATVPAQRVKQAAQTYLLLSELLIETDFLSYWGSYTEKAVKPLLAIDKFPLSTARYSVLKHALTNIEYFDMYIENNRPLDEDDDVTNFVEKLNSFLVRELNGAIDELKNSVVFITSHDSDFFVVIGTEKTLHISMINAGYLPVTELSIEVEPDLGKYQTHYLDEQPCGEMPISVVIPKQFSPGKLDISLNWTAKHLDGSDVTGTINLAVEVQSIRDTAHLTDLGASPYITGSPIEAERTDMFFGRQRLVETIKRQLPTSHRANIILLEGNRRSGKTSILYHMTRPGLLQGWIPVYCNFQAGLGDLVKPGLPTHEIFKLLSKCIFESAFKAGIKTWFPDRVMSDKTGLSFKLEFSRAANSIFTDESAFEKFEQYLQSVLTAIAPNRLLLMLDEFDKIQEGIDSGITSPQVPENFRYLLHANINISAILSYSKILRKLRNEYWSMLFGLGHRVSVGALSIDDARLLVTRPVEGKLIYSDQARDRVINLCASQPFIIQQLCNYIFDIAADNNLRTITEKNVDDAAQQLSAESEHFRTLWDHHINFERRRFLLVLCDYLEKGPDPITFKLLEIKLSEAGIFAPNLSEVLSEDLSYLRDLDLITMRENGSSYFLTIPLMVSWMRQNVDFEDQKRRAQNESDKIYGESEDSDDESI